MNGSIPSCDAYILIYAFFTIGKAVNQPINIPCIPTFYQPALWRRYQHTHTHIPHLWLGLLFGLSLLLYTCTTLYVSRILLLAITNPIISSPLGLLFGLSLLLYTCTTLYVNRITPNPTHLPPHIPLSLSRLVIRSVTVTIHLHYPLRQPHPPSRYQIKRHCTGQRTCAWLVSGLLTAPAEKRKYSGTYVHIHVVDPCAVHL